MTSIAITNSVSKSSLWTGRVLSGLAILFFTMDGVFKLIKPAPVVETCVKLGLPESTITPIGCLLLLCTVIYAIPRTAFFGAILLSAYLGGAIAIHVRAQDPTFPIVFPAIFAVITWAGITLRNPKLRALVTAG